jgi:hypothetical protein
MTKGLKFLLGFAIVAFIPVALIPVAWVIGDELSIKTLYPNCVNAEDRQLCIQLESLRGVLSE